MCPVAIVGCRIFPPEAPVDGDVVVQQDVRQAPFGTVLCDDAHVRHFDGAAYKFAQVGVVQLSARPRYKGQIRVCVCACVLMKEDLNQGATPRFFLPNLFNLLPDGFREGEMFVLDVFDGHCPPITADFRITSEFIKKLILDWSFLPCMLSTII